MRGLARGLVVTATLTAALFSTAGVGSADIGWPVAPPDGGTTDTVGSIGWPVAPPGSGSAGGGISRPAVGT
jgi:hypothetical protein